jgi:hypothetical protein
VRWCHTANEAVATLLADQTDDSVMSS